MVKANYGLYGSVKFFVVFILIAFISLIAILTYFFRVLFVATFIISIVLLFSIPASFTRSRMKALPTFLAVGGIKPNDLVLDVGTGRGFPAIEIAKAVPQCRVIGIDVWDQPAKGQIHKGFIINNTKENAEKNAIIEVVQNRVGFRQADAREMPFETGTFDVVVSFTAIHQMVYFGKEGDRVLNEIHRVLKKGGRFVDIDAMIGQRILDKVKELGFENIETENLRIFPSFLKILTATKK